MIDELLFYLPGTADNLLFFTLAVLILLMLTGVYGYLNAVEHGLPVRGYRWGWPLLSISALLIFLCWFGEPFSTETDGSLSSVIQQYSPMLAGTLAIVSGAAAVLTSNLKWSLGAAAISMLSGSLLFLQAAMVPLILLCWLILGGLLLLFLSQGIDPEPSVETEQEGPFREPLLSCLACGFLLCVSIWVVQREWGPGMEQTAKTSMQADLDQSLPELLPELFSQYWPALLVLTILTGFVYIGMTHLLRSVPHDQRGPAQETGGPQ